MFRCNHHYQGAHYLSYLKLQYYNSKLKYNIVVNLAVWLYMLSGPCWSVSVCLSVAVFGTIFCKIRFQ
jgi:hypothetical protein